MDRYLVFANAAYYPEGGWDDLRGSAETIERARSLARSKAEEIREQQPGDGWWWHIVDTHTRTVVESDDSSRRT